MDTADRLASSSHGFDDSVWLHPQLIDAIARRLLELTRGLTSEDPSSSAELLKVEEVAKRLRVSPKWVYNHQHQLGVIKLGDGRKPRLRFDPGAIDAELAHSESKTGTHQDAGTPDQGRPSMVKRTRRRLVSRPLPPEDRGPRRA